MGFSHARPPPFTCMHKARHAPLLVDAWATKNGYGCMVKKGQDNTTAQVKNRNRCGRGDDDKGSPPCPDVVEQRNTMPFFPSPCHTTQRTLNQDQLHGTNSVVCWW